MREIEREERAISKLVTTKYIFCIQFQNRKTSPIFKANTEERNIENQIAENSKQFFSSNADNLLK